MNYGLVSRLLAFLIGLFSAGVLPCIPFALWDGDWTSLIAFLATMGVGGALAGVLFLLGRNAGGEIYRREAMALVGTAWLLACLVGMLPFLFSGAIPHGPDAFFESVSGLTTSGASILTDIEALPSAILFWRTWLHFLGGLGIVVLFVAVLPLIGGGGRILFTQETTGPTPEGMTPRIKDTVVRLFMLYLGLNLALFICLLACGVGGFDALNHAISAVSTGGFSNRNASVLSLLNPVAEWIFIFFMFLGGVNFSLHLEALRGKISAYWRDPEFRLYTWITIWSGVVAAALLSIHPFSDAVRDQATTAQVPVRDAFFTVVSIKTTTGFGTVDFDLWPPSLKVMLLALMLLGGCAGSTSGGLKVIRWLILFKVAAHAVSGRISPRRVRTLKIGGRALPDSVVADVQTFFFVWFCIVIFGTFTVALLTPDQPMLTTLSAVISTLNNIGPGLEGVGPTLNYGGQVSLVKILLGVFMLLGRLELYAILVLLAPRFWRGE